MGVRLVDKMNETKVATIKWGADDVEVSYRPNSVTPALLEAVDEAAKRDDMSVMGVVLEPVLDWWDVLDAEGNRLPTDADTIARMPMPWLNLVQAGIQEDQNPPEDETSHGG